jgi:tetraacyldisaccharide 4'-kinase
MYEPSPILSPLLFIPGILFEAMVRARNRLFSMGMLPPRRLPAPVISIGNLTLGGAGKSPFVIYLSTVLRDMGAIPALLTRGYGRLSPSEAHIVPPGNEVPAVASRLGDEPTLIRRRVPEVWLGISTDRYGAGRRILERREDAVFILDDGFQYQRLHRDLNIVVIDQSQPFQSNRVFPRGSLREPLVGLRRAQMIIFNCPHSGPALDATEDTIQRIHPAAVFFHCKQEIESLVPYDRWREEGTEGAGRPASAYLVAAVGNPRRFKSDVEQLGIVVKGGRFYRDHVHIKPKDWTSCANEALRAGTEAIITTEKDAIKIAHIPAFPLLVAVQKTSLVEAAELEGTLRRLLERANAGHFAR